MKTPVTKVKVYVAGASGELARCARFIDTLNGCAGLVAHNWPATIIAAGSPNRNLTTKIRQESARSNIAALQECEIFVLLIPACITRGAWGELVAALALGKLVVLSGTAHDEDASVFCSLARERFLEDETTVHVTRPNIQTTQAQTHADLRAMAWLIDHANQHQQET